jgi:hypothetical protein
MHGKKLLHKGVLWRVGDGKYINVWSDNWIPDVSPHTISKPSSISNIVKVCSLMKDDELRWEESVIRKFFSVEVAEKILNIPLSLDGGHDFPSWPISKSGLYTVKSAYNMARTELFWSERSSSGKGSSSNQKTSEKSWKKLWAIQCPNKMKVVLWRMAHNCLPTGSQLQVRSIPTRYDCYHCNREENVVHCFLQCLYVREIWKEIKKIYGISLNLKNLANIR